MCFWESLLLNPKGEGWLFGNDVEFYSESFFCITRSSLILYVDIPLACVNLNKTNNSVVFSHQLNRSLATVRAHWQTHLLCQWDRCNLFLTLSPFIPAVTWPCLLWHSLCICSREQIRVLVSVKNKCFSEDYFLIEIRFPIQFNTRLHKKTSTGTIQGQHDGEERRNVGRAGGMYKQDLLAEKWVKQRPQRLQILPSQSHLFALCSDSTLRKGMAVAGLSGLSEPL